MRRLTRTVVGLTAAVGIAAGGLGAAGTASAAPAPAPAPAPASAPASAQQGVAGVEVAPLAVVNLGLTTTRAKHWQCFLRDVGYSPGTIDGLVGTNTVIALQLFLNRFGDNNLAIDGSPGPATRSAFSTFNAPNYCA
ncbi:peptidoglycan-binding domain-containing protein [Streptomyces sp. NPDC048002]|uniref:peptidoglycan-binding domain-containing protein n=1 Tax=Streptomyces sp. NPDC048002 TaxID=3154344 RepID=UPI00340C4E1E